MNPENTLNKAKNIAIPAYRKIRKTTSENNQRVPNHITYLSFLEKILVATI